MKTFKQITEEVIRLSGWSSKNTKPFMDDFHATTKPHPTNPHARVYNGVTLHASEHAGEIHLHDITTQGAGDKGKGSAALKHLHSLADRHNVVISGHAKAYSNDSHHITSTEKLKAWYKGHGYHVGEGSAKEGYKIRRSPKRLH